MMGAHAQTPRANEEAPRRALEGRGLQDRIDTALVALSKLAADQGNEIDRGKLSMADLHALADMPLIFSTGRFYEHKFTVAQHHTLRRVLDGATSAAILKVAQGDRAEAGRRQMSASAGISANLPGPKECIS